MASKYHDDWQLHKKTVSQRNAYTCDNELMSDVSFACGETNRIFHAHKYVLATSSAVFLAMFYGNLAQKEYPIRLPDTDEESFKEFLRFLYTDDCKITAENAIGVLYLAKKYLILTLAEKCCEILGASIKPDNVFAVLERAIQFDEEELETKCWVVVFQKTLECLNTKAFCDIRLYTLNAFLKKKALILTELELFKGILRWADSECERQGLNIKDDKTARRRVLGDTVYEIPFLTMSPENLVRYVSPSGIVTDTEIRSITQTLSGLDVPGLKWKENKRIFSFRRFDRSYVGVWNSWRCEGDPDALTLVVNKAVLFHGVRLFGDTQGRQYEVKLTIKDKNVTGTYISEQDKDGVPGYYVILPNPIPLLPNEENTIIAATKGPKSCRGTSGKSSVKINDIVVTFKDSDLSTNGTCSTDGQFYKIFLSEM